MARQSVLVALAAATLCAAPWCAAAVPAAAQVPDPVVADVVASVGLVRSPGGLGSAWVAGRDTVVTNEHVARIGTGDIYVDFSDGERVECYTAVADRDMDLSVLRCPTGDRRPVELGGAAAPGTPVVAVGYPGGVGPTITSGEITAGRREVRGIRTVGFSAQIRPGSSGSPVTDPQGRVLAVATFGGGLGVPAEHVAPMLRIAERFPATKQGAEWQLRGRRVLLAIVLAMPVALLLARRRGREHPLRSALGWTIAAVLLSMALTQAQFMLQGPAHVI